MGVCESNNSEFLIVWEINLHLCVFLRARAMHDQMEPWFGLSPTEMGAVEHYPQHGGSC